MDKVQRSQSLSIILQQLTLIDQPDLLLLARKVGPERSEVNITQTDQVCLSNCTSLSMYRFSLFDQICSCCINCAVLQGARTL